MEEWKEQSSDGQSGTANQYGEPNQYAYNGQSGVPSAGGAQAASNVPSYQNASDGAGMQPGRGRGNAPLGRSVCGIVALVLGILSFILSFIPLVNIVAVILAVIGVIFAVIGLVGVFHGKKKGKVLTIVATVLNVLAIVITMAMPSAVGSASNDSSSSSSSSSTSSPAPKKSNATSSAPAKKSGPQDTEGDLAMSHVKIDSALKSVPDYNGAPTVLVTYEWTNNSNNNQAFETSTNPKVFQNGKALDLAIYIDAPEGYDSNAMLAEVQPNATETVTAGYVLQDDSPATVEVTDLVPTRGLKVSHTFNLQ